MNNWEVSKKTRRFFSYFFTNLNLKGIVTDFQIDLVLDFILIILSGGNVMIQTILKLWLHVWCFWMVNLQPSLEPFTASYWFFFQDYLSTMYLI